MIYDLLFEMLYDYNFEMIFWKYFHSQKDCADRHFEITFFLSWGQHNRQINFFASQFEMISAFYFEMSKAFLFSFWNALWLSFWNEGGKNFRTQKYFRQENLKYFIDENLPLTIIFVHRFLRSVNVPTLALKYNFLWKEEVCYVRF